MPEQRLSGVGVTPLSGVGTVVWYAPDAELDEPPAPESVDADAERERFEAARDEAREEIRAERERTAERVGEAEAEVFDAHIQFLEDPQITEGVETAIDEGLSAEHAVTRTFDRFVEQFAEMEGRMAERADDLRDVRDRLVRVLVGGDRVDLSALPEGSVVLAERLTPSDTAQLDPERVAGFATVTGGRTSHAAIFARSLALPAVVGIGDALNDVADGADVVVDGTEGTLVVDPDDETREAAAGGEDVEIRADPVATADGTPIEVAANVGTEADVGPAADRGADGIGLYRTEFLFLDRTSPPDEDEQYTAYREALEAFPEGRVVVRTLDIGGDKPVGYLDLPDEENPFLGERGIRRSLGPDADLFETQLRALLRAAGDDAGGDLSVMLPLVTTVEEVREAREVLESVAADLDAEGEEYALPEFGVMIETPAVAFLAADLVEYVEFFSIGTNDLAQYVMAAERGNDRVADLGDYRQPAVLRAIRMTVEATEGTDVWVGMCGEMAGDPDLTELLVGLGLDELSMSAVTVPQVKKAVTETTLADARDLAERALAASTKDQVKDVLTETTQ
ncbi:phosphoenolpyruvate--protein phosphotransferase [Halobellus ordinarius]|uniref:phosphoenolpyruvate--protein phosphotransferase n=1 Tax=Halobellus ordinarius TaxID=3075120 RepID=UPI0028803B07|nr:phosphoenolpyruvate--protein phosphotransferase [Halobellus sp. ZY16]